MIRKLFILSVAILALVGMATVAGAAVVDGAHNVILHDPLLPGAAKQGACSFCHVPHGAEGDKLFPTVQTIVSSSDWTNDTVARICWSCHGIDAVSGGHPDTQNVMPFQAVTDGAHGRNAALLQTWGDITQSPDIEFASMYGYNSTTNWIACQSCHNVHDNSVRPFMRDNAIGTLTVGQAQTLCDDCHVVRADVATMDGAGATRQNHPSGALVLVDSADANVADYAAATTPAYFDGTYPDLAIENPGDGAPANQHWNLGGKFQYEVATTGIINCGTCHMTHSNEGAEGAGIEGDGLAGDEVGGIVNWGYEFLLVQSSDPNDGLAFGNGGVAPVCDACHETTGLVGPGTAGESHPYENEQVAWSISGINGGVTAPPFNAKFGGILGANAVLVCQSCHDMHFAGYSDLTDANVETALTGAECDDCHDSTTSLGGHHPTGGPFTYGTDLRQNAGGGPPLTSTDVAWDSVTQALTSGPQTNAALAAGGVWIAGTIPYYFQSDTGAAGIMTCGTCHGNNAGAHNLTDGFPALSGLNTDNEMCVDCHGINPSYFTDIGGSPTNGTDLAQLGTHLVGAITTAGYAWNYGGAGVVNPEAGAGSAQYSSDTSAGNDSDLICTSCHVIETETYTTYAASDNANDDESSTEDTIGLLLSASGNVAVDASGTDNDYICTACHGAAPSSSGSGATHPVAPNFTTNMGAVTASNAAGANNGVTLVGDNTGVVGGINCESCHRPHNARDAVAAGDKGNRLILEAADATGGYFNEQVLCNSCHSQ